MAGAQQQQQQQGGDGAYTPLWLMGGIALLVVAAWYFAQPQIVGFIIKLRLFELQIINLFTGTLAKVQTVWQDLSPANYAYVTPQQLIDLSTRVGSVLRYPIAIMLAIMAVVVYNHNAILKYKKLYSMQRLIEEESGIWPQITPIIKVDLVKEHVDKGPWAMGLTPLQFAKKQKLLVVQQTPSENKILANETKLSASILRPEAYQVFALQLGAYWQGPERLPIHAQALFAVFAARANGDRAGSANLLSKIAASAAKGKLDFTGTQELLQKHKNNKLVLKVGEQHAFNLTVMISMLLLARGDGVLASADFLWLKPLDRRLWFVLNSTGRKTPFPEVAGVFSHWNAESQLRRAIRIPMVEEAVNALELALQEVLYVPDED